MRRGTQSCILVYVIRVLAQPKFCSKGLEFPTSTRSPNNRGSWVPCYLPIFIHSIFVRTHNNGTLISTILNRHGWEYCQYSSFLKNCAVQIVLKRGRIIAMIFPIRTVYSVLYRREYNSSVLLKKKILIKLCLLSYSLRLG